MVVYVKIGDHCGLVYKVKITGLSTEPFERVTLSDRVSFYGKVPNFQIRRKTNLSLPRYSIPI